ncbi:MAG: hypothetical protein ABFD50_02750 [Smithella sp.]
MDNQFKEFVSESTKLHQETLLEQIRISQDIDKYSKWFLGLSTAGVGLLIGKFNSIICSSWIGSDFIKMALLAVGTLLFISILLGVLHHHFSIKERNCLRLLITYFGAQRIISYFNHPSYPKETIPNDMHNKITRGELLSSDKVKNFESTKINLKKYKSCLFKILLAQQCISGLSYVLFFICSITK